MRSTRSLLTPKQQAEGLLRNLKRKVADAVEEAKAEAINVAEELSPQRGSIHPYATGKFARSWVWRGNRLVNTAEYARYVDEGYTRKGRGTAGPWRDEGSIKYSDRIALAMTIVLRRALKRGR